MIRKKKQYSRPKKLYEKTRISDENELARKYGLKNKHEIWKALAKVNYFRTRAKDLAKSSMEEQNVLFDKLRALGLKINTTTDALALQVEDILRRRLPSMMHKKGLAKTPQQARQMVVHKKVRINSSVVNVPGYLVSVDEESKITVDAQKQKKKVEPKSESTEAAK